MLYPCPPSQRPRSCDTGYGLTGNRCVPCPPGCSDCQEPVQGSCVYCSDGFYYAGKGMCKKASARLCSASGRGFPAACTGQLAATLAAQPMPGPWPACPQLRAILPTRGKKPGPVQLDWNPVHASPGGPDRGSSQLPSRLPILHANASKCSCVARIKVWSMACCKAAQMPRAAALTPLGVTRVRRSPRAAPQ